MDSVRSPIQNKTFRGLNGALLSTSKDKNQGSSSSAQKYLISSMINKHYIERNRLSQPPKQPVTASRNSERGIDLTHNNGHTLTQVSSQISLHSTYQIAKNKGDDDEPSQNLIKSLEKNYIASKSRMRKSPEPIFKNNYLKQTKESFSNFTTTSISAQQQSQSSSIMKARKSNERKSKVAILNPSQKEILTSQPVMKKKYSAQTATSTKSRQQTGGLHNKTIQNQTAFKNTAHNITMNSNGATEYIINTNPNNQMLTKLNKKEKNKKSSASLCQPGPNILVQSPKVAIQLGTSMGTSSTFFSGAESVVSSQHQQNSKERKICLSEKIAPKGKKKRTNAQKQPKQISITREQIILQPQSSSSSHQQNAENQSPSKYDQSFINQTILSNFKNNITQEEMHFGTHQMNPPTAIFKDADENYSDTLAGTQQHVLLPQPHQQNINQDYNEPASAYKIDRSPTSHLFSFQNYNVNHNAAGRTSVMEESKECTGFFGALLKDSDPDYRPSVEGTAEKKPKHFEIPTPVFQNTGNRSRQSFRPSEVNTLTDAAIRITEDSHKETTIFNIKAEHRSSNSTGIASLKYDINEEQFKIDLERSQNMPKLKEEVSTQKTLKKVRSSEGIGFRTLQSDERKTLSQMNDQQQNTQSSGNLFSKLKNYFYRQEVQALPVFPKQIKYYRCNCDASEEPYACVRALKWLTFANNYLDFEYEKNKKLYDDLLNLTTPSGSETQIERDISRTFPNVDPYMNQQEGQQQLSRVLLAFSKYDTSIGYVQGMNFIVGALLMHCSEEIAFWLFVSLIEDYEMRDIYQPKLPGLYKHSQLLQLLEMEHLGKLYTHFCRHNILVEMYASDWIFALFSNIIPITQYQLFLDQFFIGGWSFFYKFSLSFLKSLSEDLQDCEDISEILTIIKLKHAKNDGGHSPIIGHRYRTQQLEDSHNRNKYNSERDSVSPHKSDNAIQNKMKNMFNKFVLGRDEKIDSESYKDDAVWDKLVELSIKEWEEEFNENYIIGLLSNFDQENLVFKQSFYINTPKEHSPPQVSKKYYYIDERKTTSINSGSKSQSRDTMSKYDLIHIDPKPQRVVAKSKSKQSQNANIYLHETQRASVQPQYRQHIPLEMIPSHLPPRKGGSRKVTLGLKKGPHLQ